MTPAAMSLWIIVAIVALGTAIGFFAGRRQKMDLEQWTVGGRRFGAALMYLLMAGEMYTTFSFLGASGWAYSRGGPSLYILAYISLGNVVSFFIMPRIWELGRRHGMQTQPDFFKVRYGNKYLSGFVCVVGIAAVVPYLQLQIEALGIIVNIASFGGIDRTPAMVVSVGLLIAFVWASGIRAVAWISVLKDPLMLAAALAIGIAIPHIYFGGIGPMFAALAHARPAQLDDAGRHDEPRSHVVCLHGPFVIARLLHVAALFRHGLHGEKHRYHPPQRRTVAAVFADPSHSSSSPDLPPFSSCPDSPTATFSIDHGPKDLSAVVSGCRRRRGRAHGDGPAGGMLVLTAATIFAKNLFGPALRANDVR